MSDPQTVREAIATAHGCAVHTYYEESVSEALGIDPDMSLETLKRRLLWGERVEATMPHYEESDEGAALLAWLTREEA